MTRLSAVAALGAALALGGCLGNEMSLQSPYVERALATTPFRQEPRLLVATSRKPASDPQKAPFFTADRGSGLTFAEVRLNPPSDASFVGRLASGADGIWTVKAVERQVTREAPAAFSAAATGHDVLLYVHGYNETFETAVLGAAVLADETGFAGRAALFAWPSGGRLLNYAYDRESALWARDGLAETLSALATNPTIGRVHIVAHSMGSFLALESLRQLEGRDGQGVLGRVGAVVLASPDVDIDQFESAVKRLGQLSERITVISAVNDRALAVSSRLAGGIARAGSSERDRLEALGVRVADASNYGSGLLRHDLFLSDPEVRAVIKRAVERAR